MRSAPLLLLAAVARLAAGAPPPDRNRQTPIPLPPFAPLEAEAPRTPPEQSRILRKLETWELPDVVRVENIGNYIVQNYESDKIIEATLLIGLDSDKIAAWEQFYEDPDERLTNLEGEIRYPDGRRAPINREIHLLEKLKTTVEGTDGRRGKNEEVSLPPKARLWYLVVPGAPPGTLVAYRAVMHYDFLPFLTLGYADAPLPTDHYRLLIRSNHKLWKRTFGGFFSVKQKLSDSREADFNPRGKDRSRFWLPGVRTKERWEADAALFARGTNLRAAQQERKGEVSELEFVANDVPAFEREPMMPADRLVRPMVAAMFSEHAPAADLKYWETEFNAKHRDDSLVRFTARRPSEKDFDRKAVFGEGDPWTRIERAAQWVRAHLGVDSEARFDPKATYLSVERKRSGHGHLRCYFLAALLREAGFQAELAGVFPAFDLPIQPELTDANFYRGPFLAVRVAAEGRSGFFDPDYDFTSGSRIPPWFWGGAAYRYAAGGAIRETVPPDGPDRNGEFFTFAGEVNASGKISGSLKARFLGITAARVRDRLKTDQAIRTTFTQDEAEHMHEMMAQERAKSAAQSAISTEAYLKERAGGEVKGAKASPYAGDKTSAWIEGGWSREGFAGDGFPMLVSDLSLEPWFEETKSRRYPVRNLLPELHRFEFDLALPAGARPARPEFRDQIAGPGGFRFNAEARFSEGHWRGFWEMMEVIDEVPPGEFAALRDAESRAFARLRERMAVVATR